MESALMQMLNQTAVVMRELNLKLSVYWWMYYNFSLWSYALRSNCKGCMGLPLEENHISSAFKGFCLCVHADQMLLDSN